MISRHQAPNNLPRELATFVGRERETEEVTRLLGGAALVTLTGAGGIGKSRLALRVAANQLAGYADGIWLVELASLTEPSLVPQAVVVALAIQQDARRPLTETLVEWLTTREVLLLIDNCEHLLMACAELAHALLVACPGLKILATSREPLRIAGELAWRVPSLSLPNPECLPPTGQLMSYAGIQLFVQRAAENAAEFALTDQNGVAVAQVCHRLGGIPLAIELAAARLGVLTVEQIATRLDQRFGLLTGGRRTALARQQTLRATVDWSYDLLTEAERALLLRVAVFAGGWTLEAAEAICAGGGLDRSAILDLLTALVDKSLVQAEKNREGARYRLLETVRAYALEKIRESKGEAILRRRHLEWFLGLAERAERNSWGPAAATWFDRLETEHDNVRAALEWSTADGGDVEAGLRLGTAAAWFWSQGGYHHEGRARFSMLLARAQRRTVPCARALMKAGYLALRQGDYTDARALLEESLAVCRELSDRTGVALALVALGEVLCGQSELRQGKLLVDEALATARESGDWISIQDALSRRGDIALRLQDYVQALNCYGEMLALCREHGYQHGIAYGLRGLGQLARIQDDYPRAQALLRESLELLVELKDKRCTPLCLEGLACVASWLGQAQRAARLFGATEGLREAGGLEELPTPQVEERSDTGMRAILDEPTSARLWAEGRKMTLIQAAEYALGAEPPALPQLQADPVRDPTLLLTPRERQVAVLITRGFTNRQIAAELVVAESTAERHVANIMDKLGVNTRAQVAVWAAERKLTMPASDRLRAPGGGEDYRLPRPGPPDA